MPGVTRAPDASVEGDGPLAEGGALDALLALERPNDPHPRGGAIGRVRVRQGSLPGGPHGLVRVREACEATARGAHLDELGAGRRPSQGAPDEGRAVQATVRGVQAPGLASLGDEEHAPRAPGQMDGSALDPRQVVEPLQPRHAATRADAGDMASAIGHHVVLTEGDRDRIDRALTGPAPLGSPREHDALAARAGEAHLGQEVVRRREPQTDRLLGQDLQLQRGRPQNGVVPDDLGAHGFARDPDGQGPVGRVVLHVLVEEGEGLLRLSTQAGRARTTQGVGSGPCRLELLLQGRQDAGVPVEGEQLLVDRDGLGGGASLRGRACRGQQSVL